MRISSTMTGAKEEFQPHGEVVKMYVCGVTPYADAHIGHAMSYIIFDMIRRYLLYRGYQLKYVQNFTDIDDKIIDRAHQQGISPTELATQFSESFIEDMDALNVTPADAYPRATEEVPKIIEVVQGLIDKGYAYPAGGSVYFRVRQMADYGKLSHRNLDDMRAGARVEAGAEKEDPMDFVVWKASKPGEPAWPSPWGEGRPGWHIECSAMSLKYLGEQIDIHGGGEDLIFPHHENEIAQSECFTGQAPFVKYWLHNGLLQLGAEKMSKSQGKMVTIKEALAKFSADALRVLVLSTHYRSPLLYSETNLEAAARAADRLTRAANRDDEGSGETLDAAPYRDKFVTAMDDDFNSAQALGTLFDLARAINQAADNGIPVSAAQAVLRELAADVLGLRLEAAKAEGDTEIDALVAERVQCRKDKNFARADEIRDRLTELGIVVEDTPQGPVWRRLR
jgi:cysteinyl-tRNA synthetase